MESPLWIATVIITFFAVILASASGIGGGSLYTPAYVLILRDIHKAIPLSKVTILGLSLSSFIMNIPKKHPTSDEHHVINFEIASILECATLLGSTIGVFLNLLLPALVVNLLLGIVLSITAYKTLSFGFKQYKEETVAFSLRRHISTQMSSQKEHGMDADTVTTDLPPASSTESPAFSENTSPESLPSKFSPTPATRLHIPDNFISSKTNTTVGKSWIASPMSDSSLHVPLSLDLNDEIFSEKTTHRKLSLNKIAPVLDTPARFDVEEKHSTLEYDDPVRSVKSAEKISRDSYSTNTTKLTEPRLRMIAIIYTLFVWSINFGLLSLAGGPKALYCGNTMQRVSIALLMTFEVGAILGYTWFIRHSGKLRARSGITETPVNKGGYQWMLDNKICIYPITGLVAGVCAGAVGIGGGLIKSPFLLYMGLNPLSAVATSTYMILFTSSSTSLSFALSGRLTLLPSIMMFLVAALAAVVGLQVMRQILRRYERQSYVSFILGLTIVISICCIIFLAVYDTLPGSHAPLTINDACSQMVVNSPEQTVSEQSRLSLNARVGQMMLEPDRI